jgi:[ribosomal protein S5]-alanine N-acetyltransferase
MTNQFPVIDTENLRLREVQEQDADELFMIFSDDETMRYYGMDPMKNKAQAVELANAFIQGFQKRETIRWAITEKGQDRLIGTCGFHNWSKSHSRIEVGYELSKNMRGKGYMLEALNGIFHYGFTEMNLNRIGATISPLNQPSINVVKRLGFDEEGLLKEYVHSNGEFHDLTMYALLKRNFKGNN